MADLIPNPNIEAKRKHAQIKAQEAAIAAAELRIMELEDEIRRYRDNIQAAYKAIERLKESEE